MIDLFLFLSTSPALCIVLIPIVLVALYLEGEL